MRKIRKIIALLSAVCLSATLFFGCDSESGTAGRGIQSIAKTSSEGLTDYYTITYTDGTTDVFTVQNGADGADGAQGEKGEQGAQGVQGLQGQAAEKISVEELYAVYVEKYPSASYEDFLNAVLSVSVDETATAIGKALQSSLQVYTEFTESYRYGYGYGNSTRKETATYMGSAVIYAIESDYTYLITNYHVIYDTNANTSDKIAERIVCYLYGSEGAPQATSEKNEQGCTVYDYGEYGIECEYVGGSAVADLAVIKTETATIKAINEDIAAIEFAQGYSVGQTAIAIGNPNGEGISVTKGVVSVDNEFISLSVDGTTRDYRSIRIDTALYGGNSGGGLFDVDGKLIGITNAGNGDDQNINYAIPLNIVKNTTESILYYARLGERSVKKITVGVTVRYENSKYVYDTQSQQGKIVEDVIVDSITANSIAEQLGLQAGDRILSVKINGTAHEINRYFEIGDLLYTVRQGDTLSVCYEREGEPKEAPMYEITASDLISVA